MGMFLEIVDLCAARISGDINNDCVVDIVDINMLIDLGWKTPFNHPGDDKAESKLQLCSTINMEIFYGEDGDEKEEDKNRECEETDHLCLFNLWEGH